MKYNKGSNNSVSAMISRYLFTYRNTPQWITGECPSTILFSRKVRTGLDLLTDSEEKSKE
jgi:hypothetical protein